MKMSTQITLFFVAFNAFAGVLIGTGVAAELGVNVQTGSPEEFEEITAPAEECDPDAQDANVACEIGLGNNVGSTLFGMYNQLTQQIGALFYSITPGFAMLKNFLPDIWVDGFLSPIAVVVVTKDIIAFARGGDL